jgi:hypothetical protein
MIRCAGIAVGAGLGRERTAEGVGVGTTEAVFWRRVRGKGYRRRACENGIVRVPHWVRIQGASETVFFPGGPIGQTEVTGVEVRTAPAVGCAF